VGHDLYQQPAPEPVLLDYYLHDVGSPRAAQLGRASLSWWSLLEILPELPPAEQPWQPHSVLLESQGLAVLRRDHRYVSLETGSVNVGHGHPDQLHLSLFADGVYWLPDPGTGDYVVRDLFWYLCPGAQRPGSTVRHRGTKRAANVGDEQDDWAWVRAGRATD
jgi:hypothetical protein